MAQENCIRSSFRQGPVHLPRRLGSIRDTGRRWTERASATTEVLTAYATWIVLQPNAHPLLTVGLPVQFERKQHNGHLWPETDAALASAIGEVKLQERDSGSSGSVPEDPSQLAQHGATDMWTTEDSPLMDMKSRGLRGREQALNLGISALEAPKEASLTERQVKETRYILFCRNWAWR